MSVYVHIIVYIYICVLKIENRISELLAFITILLDGLKGSLQKPTTFGGDGLRHEPDVPVHQKDL